MFVSVHVSQHRKAWGVQDWYANPGSDVHRTLIDGIRDSTVVPKKVRSVVLAVSVNVLTMHPDHK